MKTFKNEYQEIALEIDKKNIVVKHNDMIQKSRHQLSEVEQKTIIYAISKIQPDSTRDTLFEFDIAKYCKACNITYSGKNRNDLKDILFGLSDKGWNLKLDNGSISRVRWFSTIRINQETGKGEFQFHTDLYPYVFDLSKNFTQYQIGMALELKGKYTVILFELFKSYIGSNRNNCFILLTVDELKDKLGILDLKTYQRFNDIDRKILSPGLKEIEEKTDIFIQFVPVKIGPKGKVLVIRFDITKKS